MPEVHGGGVADDKVGFRRRVDGGYSLAPPGSTELFVGPDAFRALPKYLAQLRHSPFGQMLYPMGPKGFPDAWGTARRWGPEEETPFERMRILNPRPNMRRINRLVRNFEAMYPDLPPVQAQGRLGGHDRRDARHRAGGGPLRRPAGACHWHRHVGPWIRHRAGDRKGAGGSGHGG